MPSTRNGKQNKSHIIHGEREKLGKSELSVYARNKRAVLKSSRKA